jgi:RNA polymerase sigma-70 factor, ECF subfamily
MQKIIAAIALLPEDQCGISRPAGMSGEYSASDDAELMLKYVGGDVRAFEQLYERHKGALYRYLLRLCHDRALADDIFQEVWGRVIRSRKRYQHRAKFATFLYRIAHNCAIDQFRRSARRRDRNTESVDERVSTLAAPDSEQPDRRLAGEQLFTAFRRALDLLPEDQRAVFVLYEETGLGLDEIAEITGVGIETAKSRLRYAVNKLRKVLGSANDYRSDPGFAVSCDASKVEASQRIEDEP